MTKIRQSNFELLRILSMIAVLYGHGVSMILGFPSSENIGEKPFMSFCQIFLSSVLICGVNAFILISGWFGIRTSRRGIFKFLFQIFFLLWSIYFIFILAGKTYLNIDGIKISVGLTDGYWFIMGYLGLYILSPLLNSFVEHASKKQFQTLLMSFYAFQCYYSWLTNYVNYFAGYSIVLFCGLYLTARYLRKYPIQKLDMNAGKIFTIIIICTTIIISFSLKYLGNAMHMLRYDSPLIILASMCIVLIFNRMHFQNRIINWLAASCFAVYIIHFNPFIFPIFYQISNTINNSYSGIIYAIIIAAFLFLVYLICVLIDQIRVFFWNLIQAKV